jgi:DNA primase
VSTWIDFKALRAKLDFERVLRHYGVEIKRKGKQHQGGCPLPKHQGKKGTSSFSANLERGIFQCFGCGAKGNVLEFAALMEKVELEDGAALRKVAAEWQRRLGSKAGAPAAKQEQIPLPVAQNSLPVVVNAPLNFQLKGLDHEHSYLKGRGFTRETVNHFGLGFCYRGSLKDRIVIPLHDTDGQLVGYAGRVVDDAAVSEANPRYRFPSSRVWDAKNFEFQKSLFLYNGFRVKAPVDSLIVVQGFTSVWWLHQNGLRHTVATMGAESSEKQAELIVSLVKPSGGVWLMPNGDEAGRCYGQSLLAQIAPYRLARWVRLSDGEQPTDLPAERLKACFAR